jgi:hypothetical protein
VTLFLAGAAVLAVGFLLGYLVAYRRMEPTLKLVAQHLGIRK